MNGKSTCLLHECQKQAQVEVVTQLNHLISTEGASGVLYFFPSFPFLSFPYSSTLACKHLFIQPATMMNDNGDDGKKQTNST